MSAIHPHRRALAEWPRAIAKILEVARLLAPRVAASRVETRACLFLDVLPERRFQEVLQAVLHERGDAERCRIVRRLVVLAATPHWLVALTAGEREGPGPWFAGGAAARAGVLAHLWTRAMVNPEDIEMNPIKNTKPSHDEYDRDRGGSESGVNQVNPHNTENKGGDPPQHQGGDPGAVAPQQRQPNRDVQSK